MKPTLSEITIEIVQRCANRCIFCSSLSGKTSKHRITYDEVMNVSKQAKQLGLDEISISGGEPLLHSEITRIVNDIVQLGLRVSIYTTGVILDSQEMSQSFLDWSSFPQKSVRLIFSIQSSNEDIHNNITRNKDSFRLTKQSLIKANREGFNTEVHIVPNKSNLFSLESTVNDLASWGISQISFLRLVPQGFARNNRNLLLLDKPEQKILGQIFSRLTSKNQDIPKLRIGIPFSGVIDQPKTCNAGESKLIIRYDGKVLPCEAFKDEQFSEFILGDIKHDSLDDILNQTFSHLPLKRLKTNLTSPETCPAQLLYS